MATLKVRAIDGFWHAARVVSPGEVVTLEASAAFDLVGAARATWVSSLPEVRAARDELMRATVAIERNGRVHGWFAREPLH